MTNGLDDPDMPPPLSIASADVLMLAQRIRLARTILQRRHWCPTDQPAVSEALAALDGATSTDLRHRRGNDAN